jgi:hypothetical protein
MLESFGLGEAEEDILKHPFYYPWKYHLWTLSRRINRLIK